MASNLKPTRKVSASGIAGSVTVLVVFILGQLGVEVPPAVSAALTALLSGLAGYVVPE